MIVRHAAAEADSGRGDAARRLTLLGVEQAAATAEALRNSGLRPDAVFSSPFIRALQTATPIAEAFDLTVTATPELASGQLDPRSLVAFVEAHGGSCTVVVGHMPDVAELHGHLAGGNVDGFDTAEWRVVTVAAK